MSAQPPHASPPSNEWSAPTGNDRPADPAWVILFLKILGIIILVPAVLAIGTFLFCFIAIAMSG